jgi:hypothetical protein
MPLQVWRSSGASPLVAAPSGEVSRQPRASTTSPAENSFDRRGHFAGKIPAGVVLAGVVPADADIGGARWWHRGGLAVAADRPAQSADQPRRPADTAFVELVRPSCGGFAVRADQHLLVGEHSPSPGGGTTDRIGLARSAAVAGHRMLRPSVWRRESVATRTQRVITVGTARSWERPAWFRTIPARPTGSSSWTVRRWERRRPRRPDPRDHRARPWA